MYLQSSKTLSNGVEMPRFGLGVYKMTDHEETLQSIDTALKFGYRAIDTASLYGNEAEVGEAIRYSGIPREHIFVTTKVWNNDQGYDETLRAFEVSLKKLKMDYVDLYLTHWAVPETFEETYRAIERLYDEKLIRATGVSNHHEHHLEKILAKANIAPMVNQVEMHPYLQQQALSAYCHEHQIAVTAWSPLGRGGVLDDSTILEISKEIGKTTAQVVLRWHLQNDTLIIPKSVTPSRIEENAQIFDFELTQTQMEKIASLNRNQRFGQDPDHFKFDF
ncbi:aldo/keto reductase [Lysinibacillus sp. fkY74-1]|uniref:Plant-metabolite dehydrogenase n=3 Tax=Lysinibacillus TaxID=400634 RepID=B1HUV8_LYSSC|nr:MULTISPECIES: aldo/keto reductase [Lysinibacillus]MBG9725384.1 glyoxal reductase [Lysinibacillus fusiformis]ACA37988.1 plant-metabolite dehydrogenase [Lysinibacillus sphaericus C3-41]AMO32167.1 glyoxal reductase [Lysinibacillus sphaericus]AMR92734.1 glyoxal reductase [Lysinibacillus sphaericus]ANA46784.1 glyoxal reductase [Lysinibacillus sphaericus]